MAAVNICVAANWWLDARFLAANGTQLKNQEFMALNLGQCVGVFVLSNLSLHVSQDPILFI